jgi:hypothetical protein
MATKRVSLGGIGPGVTFHVDYDVASWKIINLLCDNQSEDTARVTLISTQPQRVGQQLQLDAVPGISTVAAPVLQWVKNDSQAFEVKVVHVNTPDEDVLVQPDVRMELI